MPDEAPTNMEELHARQLRNSQAEGFGAETAQGLACPFCGAIGFMKLRVVAVEEDMQKPATCSECGRSARFDVERLGSGGVRFRIMQTGGDDVPEWYTDPMLRE